MRPRHHTAENRVLARIDLNVPDASMRPRHHTAEDLIARGQCRAEARRFNEAAASHRGKPCRSWASRATACCFNEAAASHRGKRKHALSDRDQDQASMRPRHHTAENVDETGTSDSSSGGFNEAAASHRGKPAWGARISYRPYRASMRPRHHTAENGGAWLV